VFIDYTKIKVISGKGGDGHSSFRREKFVPKGGPDGGDGGRGGHIILEADSNLATLVDLHNNKIFRAKNGENGGRARMHGKNAADVIIKVPLGTLVKDALSGVTVKDLVSHGERIVVARGGRGGRGNWHFKTATRQAPRFYEKGEPSEEREIILELKLLADVGIIGLANAGKSTLLSKISKAHPKIADYPFTTLNPVLGLVKYDDEKSFVAADIPGLIEGAASGKGLGTDFLRHIERTRIYIHLVEPTQGGALKAYDTVNRELGAYDERLLRRPQVVAVNKSDLLSDAEKKKIEDDFRKRKVKVDFISAREKIGLDKLLRRVYNTLEKYPREDVRIPETGSFTENDSISVIRIEDNVFKLENRKAEKFVAMMDFNNEETLEVFRRFLLANGINEFLKDNGVEEGDIVVIGGKDFVFEDDK